jgi:hypothetical protein
MRVNPTSSGNGLHLQRGILLVLIVVVLIAAWNYWLPTVEDYFNMQTKPPYPPNVDFLAYYRAGERFELGQDPYYWGTPDPEEGNYSDFLYPPTFLPFFSLLARLDYDPSRLIWLGLNSLCFLAAFLSLTMAMEREKRLVFLTFGSLLVVGSYPILLHIRNGQSDLLVIGLVLIGVSAYWRGRRWVAALFFALSTLLKVSPVLFLVTFAVFMTDLAFLTIFTGLVLGIVLLSFTLVPPSLYWGYLQSVLPEVSSGTAYWLNQSLLKFFGDTPLLARGISAAGFLAFTLFAWWLRSRFDHKQRLPGDPIGSGQFVPEAVFLMNLLVILIFAGKAWSMTYVWTILPSALLLTELVYRRARRWYFALIGAGVVLMTSKVYGYVLLDSLNLVGSILVLCGLVVWLFNPRSAFHSMIELPNAE